MLTKLSAATSVLAIALLTTGTAQADQADCPPGSVEKNEGDFTWCEPSVCTNDSQCNPGYVCVPMPLCMEVGTLSKPGAATDGGTRLIARQMCAEGTCPQKQTCSDMKRCLPRATAERMGKLGNAPSSSSSSSAGSAPPMKAKNSSCGCRVVGDSSSSSHAALPLLGVAALAIARRRRRPR